MKCFLLLIRALLLPLFVFSTLPHSIRAKGFSGAPVEIWCTDSQMSDTKEKHNHNQPKGTENAHETLADQIIRQMAKASADQTENPWAKFFKDEGINEKDFGELLAEMREKEQLVGIVFGQHQNRRGQTQQRFVSGSEDNLKEIQKLYAVKENDIVMSQVMVKFLNHTNELKKTGTVSQSMKKYLLLCAKIFAIRLHIPRRKITEKRKSETKVLGKLVNLALGEKRQNAKQKNGQNDKEKNGQNDKRKTEGDEEEMLRLLYTAADNMNIPTTGGNIAKKSGKANRHRRKRRGLGVGLTLVICLFVGAAVVVALYDRCCISTAGRDTINQNAQIAENIGQYTSEYIYQVNVDTNEEECSVCLEEFRNGEKLKKLDVCTHFFHEECIKKSIKKAKSVAACPLCRAEIKRGNQDNEQSAATPSAVEIPEHIP